MRRTVSRLALVGLTAIALSSLSSNAFGESTHGPHALWRPAAREAQRGYESALTSAVSQERIRAFHDRLASQPHIAGTPGDAEVVEYIAQSFADMGLEVERHELRVLLPEVGEAEVEVIDPAGARIALPLEEPPIESDPDTSHPALTRAWNAWSASGDVTAPVVYANYGRKEDFERLHQLGVDVKGSIVIARYGGNFRGMKAKYAELAGAVGLIIFTDPADSGFMQGLTWPDGGFANEHMVQRGSVVTLDNPGDPFTPFFAATPNPTRPRLTDVKVGLPGIPVQPIGWGAAREILSRMAGPTVPPGAPGAQDSWQGGLPFTYRLTGGAPALKVRLMVNQPVRETTIWNVIGTLRGAELPGERVIVGCHHDAWCFGAQDPTSGTMILMELARVFGEAARAGARPKRSIVFAAWAAEEFSIVGSTEWVEGHADALRKDALAYMNLDAATFGLNFGGSSAPILKPLIARAVREVYHESPPGDPPAGADQPRAPFVRISDMGGGSDHVAFWSHLAIPSFGIGSGGARGHAYHSNYDTLKWWRSVVGDDYLPGAMLAKVGALVVSRLASADVLPYDPSQPMQDVALASEGVAARAEALGAAFDPAALRDRARALQQRAELIEERIERAVEAGEWTPERLGALNRPIRSLASAFFDPAGLPDRPWHRNLYVSPDETSGYSAWLLPGVRRAIELEDPAGARAGVERLMRALDDYEAALEDIDRAIK